VTRRVVRSALARRDIAEIALYLGQDEPELVDRFLQGILETCERLAHAADSGSPFEFAPVSMPDMRHVPIKRFPKYYIFYRIAGAVVRIHRVLHSARDPPGLIDPDG
jgi:toxin ParE1/3/4